MQDRSVKDIRHAVVKNQGQNQDANVMAQLENQKSMEVNYEKKNKIQNFMNSTKLNASKIYKQQQEKKIENLNMKKIMTQKQKQVKAKYTVIQKKKQEPRMINVQPTKVDWKKAGSCKAICVPNHIPARQQDSEDEASGIDSEAEQTNIRTPEQLMKQRADIRSKMFRKLNQK